jgi:hypothetical protein
MHAFEPGVPHPQLQTDRVLRGVDEPNVTPPRPTSLHHQLVILAVTFAGAQIKSFGRVRAERQPALSATASKEAEQGRFGFSRTRAP